MYATSKAYFIGLLLIVFAFQVYGQNPELNIQTGHASFVVSVAFSSDGKIVASGGVDKTIILWDTATGYQLRALKGHDGTINGVAFSPDNRLLASGCADGVIKIWDVSNGREIKSFTANPLNVTSVAFSPDGKLLASAGYDQIVKLWDVATWREVRTLVADPNPQMRLGVSVLFTSDGKTLASSGEVVKLFDVRTGRELQTLNLRHVRPIPEIPIAFTPDGKSLATGGANVNLWEVTTGKLLRTVDADVRKLSFAPDGRTLAGNTGNSILLLNMATGEQITEIHGSPLGMEALAYSADGRFLASGNADHTITLWDPAKGQPLRVLKGHGGEVTTIALSDDGRVLTHGMVGIIGYNDVIKVWDPTSGQLMRALNRTPSFTAYSIALSNDGKRLVSGGAGKTVGLWNVAQSDRLGQFAANPKSLFVPDRVALSNDGRVVAAGGRDGTIKLWEVDSGRELFELKGHTKGVWDLCFSPDGQILASAGQDNLIKLWSVPAGRELKTLTGHVAGVTSVRFSPDGKKLLSGGQDKVVFLWNISLGHYEQAYGGHKNWVNTVAFSRDGKLVAAGDEDGVIRLWDAKTANPLKTFSGHADRVRSLAFNADGTLLISGSSDTSMKLWDVATGKELGSLFSLDHEDWLVLTPDGLFDGSPAAWSQILWRFSPSLSDVAPVEIFFNEYYYPGLLADLYAGKRPAAPQSILQKDRRQPKVELSLLGGASDNIGTRTVSVKIDIASAPAGAQDVRLFRNGSLVKAWRGDVLKGQPRTSLQADIPIVAGANRLTAYAFNRENVKSSDAMLTVTGADTLKKSGTLYVLAIAVNKYANPQFDLRYAVADATDFASELKLQESKLNNYARTEIISLSDAQATKANVVQALSGLATRVQPEDAVVVYYAGHGTAQQNQFYLIPHDLGYSGSRTAIDAIGLQTILSHSISDRELEQALERVDAGEFLLVIDACNSGQALEAEEKRRGPMNSRGLAQLAYEKGISILTAAQSYQAALEPADLKHGLLTYALVEEGLKQGTGDSEPKDGVIFAREWFSYAMKRVPQIQEERMRQASEGGRQLAYVDGDESNDLAKRKLQRPRAFYRRELEAVPFVVARISADAPSK